MTPGPTSTRWGRCFTRWRPEDGRSRRRAEQALITAILAAEPKPLAEARPETPEGLERAVARCLAKDPEERCSRAGTLRASCGGSSTERRAASRLAYRETKEDRARAARAACGRPSCSASGSRLSAAGTSAEAARPRPRRGHRGTRGGAALREPHAPAGGHRLAGAPRRSLTVGVQDQRPLRGGHRERVVELFGQRSCATAPTSTPTSFASW